MCPVSRQQDHDKQYQYRQAAQTVIMNVIVKVDQQIYKSVQVKQESEVLIIASSETKWLTIHMSSRRQQNHISSLDNQHKNGYHKHNREQGSIYIMCTKSNEFRRYLGSVCILRNHVGVWGVCSLLLLLIFIFFFFFLE